MKLSLIAGAVIYLIVALIRWIITPRRVAPRNDLERYLPVNPVKVKTPANIERDESMINDAILALHKMGWNKSTCEDIVNRAYDRLTPGKTPVTIESLIKESLRK